MRWAWIDRFVAFRHAEYARAVKLTSLAEDIFRDHIPGFPVMPASLMLEGLAQTGGMLVGEARGYQEKVVLAKMAKVRFTREVLAGSELVYEVWAEYIRPEGALVRGTVTVEGELVGEAEITFAHLDQSRSQQTFGDKNFVFTGLLAELIDSINALLQAQGNTG
jgi:3-hydroxyacyl-[acyl-carrier-protein] dehydratase